MKVRDIMNKEVIKVTPDTPLKKLISLFRDFHTFPMVPVVDEGDRLIGKVSLENLLDIFQPYTSSTRKLLRGVPFLEEEEPFNIFKIEITPEMAVLLVIEDFMDKKVISINQDEELQKAYQLMNTHNLEHIPVVDNNGRLVGMLGIFDLVIALFKDKGIV